mmetsp:Transcript_3229/g.8942  ORF Transcript_3229/g.8942 Transcript_3229/m.8942 type:complete len:865 (+) Transcript_3229:216-2810(+)
MSGNHLISRIPKLGGTRQLPYAVLAVAATSVVGILSAKNSKDSIKEEEDTSQPSSRVAERQNKQTDERSKASASLYQNFRNNLPTSNQIHAITPLENSTATAACLCERRTQQVPGNDPDKFDFKAAMSRPMSGKPQSILTQDQNTALVRKHRTLRLLDKYKTQTSVESKYNWNKEKMVGEGAYSKVYRAVSKDSGEQVALKNISKKYTDSQYFQQEVEAMLYIQEKGGHPHVITLHEHFEDGDSYILILDFIQGGELFDHLIEMGAYSEMDASRIVREVASALLYLHGIGLVHADLKPENVLLTTTRRGDSVVKVADFGTAVFVGNDSETTVTSKKKLKPDPVFGAPTPAYSPPESILRTEPIQPSMDMWSLGVILFIMLTGCHPYDVSGESTDEEIENRIKSSKYQIPINDPEISGHISRSAKDLITKLMNRDAKKRLSAYQMLQHPWVRGETATTAIIQGSDQRLSKFRVFKSRLQAKFFENAILLSDIGSDADASTKRKTSLIERSFKAFDSNQDGHVSAKEILGTDEENIEEIVEGGGPAINISDYENLLSENMENMYFAAGHTIYDEGQKGHDMYFLESGAVEVIADGTRAVRTSGDFFGEGALLHPRNVRSATVRCLTPVHALKISQEYFEKYIASSGSGLYLTLKEKDKIRKRNRAKTILRMQAGLKTAAKPCKSKFYKQGEEGDTMWILEKGKVDVQVADGNAVFSVYPGNIFGEHAVITGKNRNCDAVCVSKEGCVAQALQGREFRKLLASSTSVQDSLKELYLRREFKKAIVMRMRKNFPYDDPEEAFAAADEEHVGRLNKENVSKLMREMNPDFTDEEVEGVIHALNLTGSGSVTFEEMKKALVGDLRTSASM